MSLLTLPKVKRSVQDANTIRYNIEFHHRYPRVVETKNVMGCTFNIPIQYIIQAEGYERIRDEDRAQVNNLKDSMAWQPYSFQNSSLVYVVDRATGEQLKSASEFNVNQVSEGKYLFVCFGHQHSLTARRELHDEQPTKESWWQIECKLYINLQSDIHGQVLGRRAEYGRPEHQGQDSSRNNEVNARWYAGNFTKE